MNLSATSNATTCIVGGESGERRVTRLVTEALEPEYRILRQLSAGEMSHVFEAFEERLQRRVALKVLPPSRLLEADGLERFLREARIAARLEHPRHVVQIYNISCLGEYHFFTMGFACGGTLRRRLESHGRFSESEARRLLTTLLWALRFVHAQGAVHCDLKPENVLFDEEGGLLLTDFGIARLRGESDLNPRGLVMGTPSYISPEQVSGKEVEPRSDLYAVGVMIYEMLSGELPFCAENVPALLMKQVYEQPAPLQDKAPWVSPRFAALVHRLLAKEPESRPATVDSVLAELEDGSRVSLSSQETYAGPIATLSSPAPVLTTHAIPVPPAPWWQSLGRLQWTAVLVLSVLTGVALVQMQGMHAEPGDPLPAVTETEVVPAPEMAPPTVAAEALPDVPAPISETRSDPAPETAAAPAPETAAASARKPAPPRPRPSRVTPAEYSYRAPSGVPAPAVHAAPLLEAPVSSAPPRSDLAATPAVARRPAERSYQVEHDHVVGNCTGTLVFRPESLVFVSEKDKDSRQWEYAEIRKASRKGADRLELVTEEKDIKKLGFASRSYKFKFLQERPPDTLYEKLPGKL